MAKRKSRNVGDYLKSARRLADVMPSLQKYAHRKTLTRWEKSAITRKEKLRAEFKYDLVPISKANYRKLKEKAQVITRGGLRAIKNREGVPTKISVRNGELVIRRNGREFRNPSAPKSYEGLEAQIHEAFKAKARGKLVTIWLRNQYGRMGGAFGIGTRSENLAIQMVRDFKEKYSKVGPEEESDIEDFEEDYIREMDELTEFLGIEVIEE